MKYQLNDIEMVDNECQLQQEMQQTQNKKKTVVNIHH